tara:strand:+ start:220 stop:324 length:105 start_codon:yes stop_codon:yes gene_type:complete
MDKKKLIKDIRDVVLGGFILFLIVLILKYFFPNL